MTIAGQLEIQLMADIARLKADMEKAVNIVNVTARSFDSAAKMMKGALAGIAAGFTMSALTSFVSNVAEAAEKLHDLSQVTGASVESLSALASVGKLTGTSVDNIADMMTKLARNMAGAREEGKGTGAALRALGVDFDSFKRLRPEEQMQALAKALDRFSDGGGKAAAVQAILGKGAAAQIPFLKELAATQGLAAKLTTEQAAAGDLLHDNIIKIRASQEGWKKEIAAGLLPVLADASEALLGIMNKTSGVRDKTRELQKDGSLSQWAEDSLTTLSYLIDGLQWVGRAFSQLGQFTGALMASGANFVQTFANVAYLMRKGEMRAAWEEMNKGARAQAAISEGFLDWSKRTMGEDTLGAMFRKRLAEVRALRQEQRSAAADPKPDVDFTNAAEGDDKDGKAAARKAEAQADAYRNLVARIRERIAANGLEAQSGRELTEAQKAQLEIDKLAAEGKLASSDASSLYTRNLLVELAASQQISDEAKRFLKTQEANAKATEKKIDDAEKSADRMREETQQLRDQTATLGLEGSALAGVEANRLRDTAARKEARAATEELIDPTSGVAKALRDEAAAMRDLADARQAKAQRQEVVKQEQDALKQTRDMWESIDRTAHDVFVNMWQDGSATFKRLGQTLKAALLDMLYQMTVKRWIINIGASMTGGGGVGSMASSALGNGMGSVLSSAGSIGAQYFAGSMSGANAAGTLYANATGAGLDGLLATNGAYGTAAGASGGAAGAGAGAASFALPAAAIVAAMMVNGSLYDKGYRWENYPSLHKVDPLVMGLNTKILEKLGLGGKTGAMLTGSSLVVWAADKLGLAKPGGPKAEMGYGYGIERTPNADSAQQVADSIREQYKALAGGLGGTPGALDVGYFSATDPRGTARTQLAVNAALNGTSIYSRASRLGGIENVGRSSEDLQAAVTEETQRVILKALQASGLLGAVGDYLRKLGDIDALSGGAVSESIAKLQRSATERAALLARVTELTTNDVQKLNAARQKEIDSLDDTNQALYMHVIRLEDSLVAVERASAGLEAARSAVAEAYSRESSELEQAAESHRAYAKQLRETSDALAMELMPTSAGRTALASEQFRQTFGLAMAGNADALQSLGSAGAGFVDEARGSSQTRLEFLRAVGQVRNAVSTVAMQEDARASVAEQQLDAMKREAESLGVVNDSLLTFAQAVQGYTAALATLQRVQGDLAAEKQWTEAQGGSLTSGGALGALGDVLSSSGSGPLGTVGTLITQLAGGVPHFAAGGIASGWAVVGENGPELARFDSPARIYTASDSAAVLAGSDDVAGELRAVRALIAEMLAAARASATYDYKCAKALDDMATRGVQVRNSDDGTPLEVQTV